MGWGGGGGEANRTVLAGPYLHWQSEGHCTKNAVREGAGVVRDTNGREQMRHHQGYLSGVRPCTNHQDHPPLPWRMLSGQLGFCCSCVRNQKVRDFLAYLRYRGTGTYRLGCSQVSYRRYLPAPEKRRKAMWWLAALAVLAVGQCTGTPCPTARNISCCD